MRNKRTISENEAALELAMRVIGMVESPIQRMTICQAIAEVVPVSSEEIKYDHRVFVDYAVAKMVYECIALNSIPLDKPTLCGPKRAKRVKIGTYESFRHIFYEHFWLPELNGSDSQPCGDTNNPIYPGANFDILRKIALSEMAAADGSASLSGRLIMFVKEHFNQVEKQYNLPDARFIESRLAHLGFSDYWQDTFDRFELVE